MVGSGWCARSVQAVRERGWVFLWLLVGSVIVLWFAGVDWVGADHGGTTDTTAVVGTGTDRRDHGGEQPPNCSHGSYTINPGTGERAGQVPLLLAAHLRRQQRGVPGGEPHSRMPPGLTRS